MKVVLKVLCILIFLGCGCTNIDQHGQLSSSQFIKALKKANLKCDITPRESQLDLLTAIEPKEPSGIYLGQEFSFALFEDANLNINDLSDLNNSLVLIQNHNLILSGKGLNADPYVEVFESLRPSLTILQLGFFIYPLGNMSSCCDFCNLRKILFTSRWLDLPQEGCKSITKR